MTEQINIFDEPEMTYDEIVELRQEYTNASQWETFVDLNFPDLDPAEEYKLKIEENRQANRQRCGNTYKGSWCPTELKFKTMRWYCKQKDCPICQNRKKQQFENRLDDLMFTSTVVTINQDDEKNFKAGLKEDYIRIPRANGEVSFILQSEHESGKKLDFNLKQELAQASIELPGKQRVTGNLGKIVSCSTAKQEVVEVLEEVDNILQDAFNVDIKTRKVEIAFQPDSKLKSTGQIEKEVLKRLNAAQVKYDIYALQWLINELEQLTEQVCKDNAVIYNSLSIETISVNPDNIKWDSFEDRLLKAQSG